MASEINLQKRILTYCKQLSNINNLFYYERRIAQGIGYKKGLPDLFIVYNGRHVEIELKDKKGSLSPLQLYYREHFKKANITHAVIRSFDEFLSLLNLLGITLLDKK